MVDLGGKRWTTGKGQIILKMFFLGKPLKSVGMILEREDDSKREVVKKVAVITAK